MAFLDPDVYSMLPPTTWGHMVTRHSAHVRTHQEEPPSGGASGRSASTGSDRSPFGSDGSGERTAARRTPRWPERYASRLFYSDVVVLAVSFSVYALLAIPEVSEPVAWAGGPQISYGLALVILGVIWLICLDVVDSRDRHTVGDGFAEYQRIVRASLFAFGIALVIAFFLRIDLARSLFILALPIGAILLIVSRSLWRRWLHRRQIRGTDVHRAVVIGEREKVGHIIRSIRRASRAGIHIVGAVTERGTRNEIESVPVLGSYSEAERTVDDVRADTVIVAGADDLNPQTMRELGWAMADRDVAWIVAPALTDVAGPRIHARPVAGLPLVHVSFPKLEGVNRMAKRTFDIVGSFLLLLLLSPVMIVLALAVKFTSSGPIFYSQERIGRRGRRFGMLKFRSMVADADDQLAGLLDLQGTTDKPLFKVTNDPRITRVGRVLRRYSLDELPQLINVLRGDMSLVGPRPQRQAEVELYDDAAHRRLLVKPGMSGLWQVSGRSTLSWEDSLRLDLYYVENWSFTQDIVILLRTFRAVVAPGETAH